MWEYKLEYVALFPSKEIDYNIHTYLLDGRQWWEKELIEILNKLGAQGWQVVSIPERLLEGDGLDGHVLLKRPSPTTSEQSRLEVQK